MININGPEGRNIKGSHTEDEIEAFFSNFAKWKLLYRNVDVSFLNVDNRAEENRGVDFLYRMYEPFESATYGVIIESKKVKDKKSFSKSRLADDIYTLKRKIQKAQNSKELYEDGKIRNDIEYFKYGILCYRFNDFDSDHFRKVLQEVQIKDTKRGALFPIIFILSNDRLSRFVHMRKLDGEPIKYYYPPYGANKWMVEDEKLSLYYLFSDIIPFYSGEVKSILSFDMPSPRAFQFMADFCTRFSYDVSKLILAKGNYENIDLCKQHKKDWENDAGKEFDLLCLNSDLNCSESLGGVFKNE